MSYVSNAQKMAENDHKAGRSYQIKLGKPGYGPYMAKRHELESKESPRVPRYPNGTPRR